MSSPVTVNIMGREYQVACPEDEKQALLASARMVDENMEQIRASGKIVGLDRIAVMAALNLAHDLYVMQNEGGDDLDDLNDKISQIKERVSAFLEEDRQLEL